MKFIIMTVALISLAHAASRNLIETDQIKSMKLDGDIYVVQFWKQAQIFKVPKNSPVVPCLESAVKSTKGVALEIDPHHGELINCKLASGKLPVSKK